MDARQIKGLQIAREKRITETPKGWIVPSQSGAGSYLVYKENMARTVCTCPDCEMRDVKCKHQWAVDYFLEVAKTIDNEGNVTVTKTVRATYPQNWPAYNKAQVQEIELFDKLLKDLVAIVPNTCHEGRGRPNMDMQESLFCAVQKVYSQLSQRRAHTLYRNAQGREQIGHAPHFNAIGKLLNREDITPTLHQLLTITALPLKGIETTFIPDSSGFRTSQFGQYCVEKYGLMKKHKWIKCHVLTGAKTGVIASARITEEYGADCPQFEPLVMEAHQNGFDIREIPADMGYLSRDNYNLAQSIGAQAWIPFKDKTTDRSKGSYVWTKMFHFYQLHREEFMQHYHQRSNVESDFNAVKMKFGDRLKSKNYKAQENELLCKLIAHNIVCLIASMFELGIKPEFAVPQ